MFLLDTNVISELRKSDRAHPSVAEWAHKQAGSGFYLSAISILEIESDALRISRRDLAQGELLRNWVSSILIEFAGHILPLDAHIMMRCAALHVPDPKPDRDAFIGATALVHDFTVVTRNTMDFVAMGVRLLNPWHASDPK